MKSLKQHIKESFKISKNKIYNQVYNYKPESRAELIKLVQQLIFERGTNADLNDIDVSEITDMELLFNDVSDKIENIHIENWDVSKVTNMRGMFAQCKKFNCDLSKWDVSSVKDMEFMFTRCENFDSDLGDWDVSHVKDMGEMFKNCVKFSGKGLDNWNISRGTIKRDMLNNTLAEKTNLPKWY
jgi:surface protein